MVLIREKMVFNFQKDLKIGNFLFTSNENKNVRKLTVSRLCAIL